MEVYRSHVLVCTATPCVLLGARSVRDALVQEIERLGLSREVKVVETGCLGPCAAGPVIVVYPEGSVYGPVTPADVPLIVGEHLLKGRVVQSKLAASTEAARAAAAPATSPGAPAEAGIVSYQVPDYLGLQQRVVLRNCGAIDPESLDEYVARDGYAALAKCLTMTPDEVLDVIQRSGLVGRGGAAFPTGLKWRFTKDARAERKFVICNADEGEPGTFKDRLILEGDPHSILEAMAIAGYVVGANLGFIYIRGEYGLSVHRMNVAIRQARAAGLLGGNILGSGFSFDVEVRVGAGAYVCGEETALIESIEGNRGEPRNKPPFPGTHGLWGMPTVVNNVETLANIPPILRNGPEWFRGIGSPKCPGTKVFTLTGDVYNRGLIEVPMGITLRKVIYEIGGGIPRGRGFKMAQTGGTSGGCLPASLLDTPMDYVSLAEAGSALGSGALLVIDSSHCIVDVVHCFMRFFEHESCGKCTPCRIGTARLRETMARLADAAAQEAELEAALRLCQTLKRTSLCGLGQSAPVPVVTALTHFRDEVLAHARDGVCPTGVCPMRGPEALAQEAGRAEEEQEEIA